MQKQKGIAPIIIILIIAVVGLGTYQVAKVNNEKKTIEEFAKEQQKEEKKEIKKEEKEVSKPQPVNPSPVPQPTPEPSDRLQEIMNEIVAKLDQTKQLIPNIEITKRNRSNISYKYGLVGYDFLEEKVDARCIERTGTYDHSLDSVKKANNIFSSIFKDWERNDYMEGSATIKWSYGYIKPADKIFCSIFGSSDGYGEPVSKITEEICCGYYKNAPLPSAY